LEIFGSHAIFRKMIKTEKLTRVFRTDEVETFALLDVDIHVKEGEFVSIMGPSGCGKSTLLHILGLLDDPTGGSYWLNGTEVSSLNVRERSGFIRENIGFVFQQFLMIDELNVYDNIRLPLNYHKIRVRERKERVRQVLERMKMGHRALHYPQQLSGGQQQRIAIARAVVTNPRLILADEPTGNLDSKNGLEVMNLLAELNREGTTIVMVTHSERDAGFAHRTINLFDGKVMPEVANTTLNGVKQAAYHKYADYRL
jgi:putative ABC transport system ATP-binding protein